MEKRRKGRRRKNGTKENKLVGRNANRILKHIGGAQIHCSGCERDDWEQRGLTTYGKASETDIWVRGRKSTERGHRYPAIQSNSRDSKSLARQEQHHIHTSRGISVLSIRFKRLGCWHAGHKTASPTFFSLREFFFLIAVLSIHCV